MFATETEMLRERGHEVFTYARQTPADGDAAVLVRLAGQAFWNQAAYLDLRRLIRDARPDVVHLHNTFPLISPAACYAAGHEDVAIVQTLHNYRLLCPNGLFFRDGRPCEDCLHAAVPWPAVIHACYRNSYAASLAAAGTLAVHRAAGTWATRVDRYIALTEFARQKFIAGGLQGDRIAVKPHLVHPDPGPGDGAGGYALYVGRLSREKGIHTLLAAWDRLTGRMPLTIVGDGPLAPLVRRAVAEQDTVTWLGHRDHADIRELLGGATCAIVPSACYETFGLVIAEAFARGTPVVAARLGALVELVQHGRTGLQFRPGDAADLARQLRWFAEHPAEAASMRDAARAEYERRYTAGSNYPILRRVYAEAMARRREPGGAEA